MQNPLKNKARTALAATLAALGLSFTATACTPVQAAVAYPSSTQAEASARSLNHATLRDDGTTITATNPNGNNYAALNANGSYSNQVLPIGSAAIGAAGVFVSDPKDTSAESVVISFATVDDLVVFFDDEGNPYTVPGITTSRAVPLSVAVEGFNADGSSPLRELRGIAEIEAAKFAAMEETERAVFLEEIKQRGDLYRQVFSEAVDALGIVIPNGLNLNSTTSATSTSSGGGEVPASSAGGKPTPPSG